MVTMIRKLYCSDCGIENSLRLVEVKDVSLASGKYECYLCLDCFLEREENEREWDEMLGYPSQQILDFGLPDEALPF